MRLQLNITPKGIQEWRTAKHVLNSAMIGELRASCEIQYQTLAILHLVHRAGNLATFICRFS